MTSAQFPQRFHWYNEAGSKITVIGVAGDVRNRGLDLAPMPIFLHSDGWKLDVNDDSYQPA
jgi:hypothetical protein